MRVLASFPILPLIRRYSDAPRRRRYGPVPMSPMVRGGERVRARRTAPAWLIEQRLRARRPLPQFTRAI